MPRSDPRPRASIWGDSWTVGHDIPDQVTTLTLFDAVPMPRMDFRLTVDQVQQLIRDLGGVTPMIPGAIIAYGSTTIPDGWLLCDGSAISRADYADLFAVIGTTFGVGNGTTTFNVPDHRGRFIIGKAASGTGSTLGGTGGNIDHTHTMSFQTGTPTAVANSPTIGTAGAAAASHKHDVIGTTASANPPFITEVWLIKY